MATLAEEYPFAAVVITSKLSLVCSNTKCFVSNNEKPYNRCSRCKVIHYCSRDCQKHDWNDHKYECQFLCRVSPRIPTSMARLIARISMRLQTSQSPVPVAFNGNSFDKLMDHKEEIRNDPDRSEFYVCISHMLYDYMGPAYVPKPAELMRIFGKIVTNCFKIVDNELETKGEGIYVGLSIHDHSCDPDAFIIIEGSKALLRSPDSNEKYSKNVWLTTFLVCSQTLMDEIVSYNISLQLRISYVDLMSTNKERRRRLQQQYYFECDCKVCQDKERDFWARSVTASCCEGGLCLLNPDDTQLYCYKCGTLSRITVDEGMAANQELEMILDKIDKEKEKSDKSDLGVRLVETIGNYERFEKVLSPLNIALAIYGQRILHLALDLQQYSTATKYATVGLTAFKRYLREGHTGLTVRLYLAAMCLSFDPTTKVECHQQLEQAMKCALLSHGPRNALTVEIGHVLSTCRAQLSNEQRKWESY